MKAFKTCNFNWSKLKLIKVINPMQDHNIIGIKPVLCDDAFCCWYCGKQQQYNRGTSS